MKGQFNYAYQKVAQMILLRRDVIICFSSFDKRDFDILNLQFNWYKKKYF